MSKKVTCQFSDQVKSLLVMGKVAFMSRTNQRHRNLAIFKIHTYIYEMFSELILTAASKEVGFVKYINSI